MTASVIVAYAHPGEVNGFFHDSLLRLLDYDRANAGQVAGRVSLRSGPRIATARNTIVRKFLESGAEWLWMLDTDMTFSHDTLERLMAAADPAERPVVGALCFGGSRGGVVFPTLYRLRPPGPNQGPIEVIREYPPDALVKVDATGAACVLMHRSVFERIADFARPDGTVAFPEPMVWFAETVYAGIDFGEDWTFCMRAQQVGVPIHVHTGIKIGHVKPAVVDEAAYIEYRERAAVVGEGGVRDAATRSSLGLASRPSEVPTYVVVPMKDKAALTIDLLRQLETQDGCNGVYVADNGSHTREIAKVRSYAWNVNRFPVEIVPHPKDGITAMWNAGIVHWLDAEHDRPVNVAVLNNDLALGPNFLSGLSKALRADDKLWAVCPNYDGREGHGVSYVLGTYGNRGMSGFAFMVKAEAFSVGGLPLPDERMRWWYSDDDLAWSIEERGHHVGLVHGTSVVHLDGGSQTAKDHDLDAQIQADRAVFAAKWGHRVRMKEPTLSGV